MRKSTTFAGFIFILCAMTFWTVFSGRFDVPDNSKNRMAGARMVKNLGLTDLALFTEAAYLRHLSQADRHMAFRNHPAALEHFPGGALIQPPEHLKP